jgi:hypothetical protein
MASTKKVQQLECKIDELITITSNMFGIFFNDSGMIMIFL